MKRTVFCRTLACILFCAASIAGADPDVYIVNTGSDNVSVIDSANNQAEPQSPIAIPQVKANNPSNNGPFFIAINRTGTRAYIADATDDEVEVIDLATNTRLSPIAFPAGEEEPLSLAFKPGTDLLYVVLAGSLVRVIDTAAGGSGMLLPGSVNHNGAPTRIVFNGDGSRAYVGNRTGNNVAVFNTTTTPGTRLGGANDNITVGPSPVDIDYDPIRNRIVTANFNDGPGDGNVSVLSINPAGDAVTPVSGQPITFAAGFKPNSIALNRDRSLIFVTEADAAAGVVRAFSNGATVSNTAVYSFNVGNTPTIPVFRADGRVFVPNAGDNTVSVFDTSATAAAPVITLTAPAIGTLPRRIAIRETGTAGGAGTIQFSAATYTVGEAGPAATITVTRTGGSTGAASAQFATSNGTATSGSDYTTVTQAVNFAAGDMANKTVTVPITQDAAAEGSETVNLNLSAVTGAAPGSPQSATLTIIDDDSVPPPVPPPPPPPPAGDGGGGGGCSANPSQTFDPTLLVLLLTGMIYLSRRYLFRTRFANLRRVGSNSQKRPTG